MSEAVEILESCGTKINSLGHTFQERSIIVHSSEVLICMMERTPRTRFYFLCSSDIHRHRQFNFCELIPIFPAVN